MKKIFLFAFIVLSTTAISYAQVGINAAGTPAAASAMLDISGNNKGILIPRIALTGTNDVLTIPSPAVSLMVYNTAATTGITAVTPGYYFYTAAGWQKMMNVPAATALGQTLYWNGTDWVAVPAGLPGQYFQIGQNNLPVWTGAAFATITTTGISGTTYYMNATSGGNITADGGSPVTARGVCWNTLPNPTIANTKTNDGTGTGSYSSSLSGLLPNTLYYVRAYATNTPGTAYGNEVSFTTVPHALPTLSTAAVTGVTGGTANSGVNVTAENGSPVTAKGVCWSISPNPTIANSKTTDGAGTGAVPSFINGLATGTTYYVRAYATNGLGTAYGNPLSFTTTSALTIGGGYQGGIIAYFYQVGDPGYVAGQTHGLIAAPSDQRIPSVDYTYWSHVSISNVTATALGTGYSNSQLIWLDNSSNTDGANVCFDLVLGGYSDWFLPSKDELNKLYLNKTVIGGFANYTYWSSSGINNPSVYGWTQHFANGFQDQFGGANYSGVRAVRYF